MKIWICHNGSSLSGVAHLFHIRNPHTSLCGEDFDTHPKAGVAFALYCRKCQKADRVSPLYLYRISFGMGERDTYDSAVVVSASQQDAQKIHPSKDGQDHWSDELQGWDWDKWDWATHAEDVVVELLGVAAEGQKAGTVVCASFNAG